MAATLSPFTFKWGPLNAALNKIVDAINRNAPLEGDNIQLDEKGQHGVSINAVRSKNAGTAQQSDTGNGGGGSQPPSKILINNTQWLTVTTVDPSTCAQTQIAVLAKGAGMMTELDYVGTNPDGSWQFQVTT